MPKETGKAAIVLLYGTSTAGKSTICRKVQELGLSYGSNWAIDGHDSAFDSYLQKNDQQ